MVDSSFDSPVKLGVSIPGGKLTITYPCLLPDGMTLYFSCSESEGRSKPSDYWQVHRLLKEGTVLPSRIATDTPEAKSTTPTASPSPTTVKESSINSPRADPQARAKAVGLTPYEILTSPDYHWSTPENLGLGVNSDAAESSPFLSTDGLTLFFESWRNKNAQSDLFMSRRSTSDQPFGPAENLGQVVNSIAAETGPCLTTDGLNLFFSSNRTGGLGKSDIWVCRRDRIDAPWSAPENVGVPVNTVGGEAGPHVIDGFRLYWGGGALYMASRSSLLAQFGTPIKLLGIVPREGESFWKPTLSGDERVMLFSRTKMQSESIWFSSRMSANDAFNMAAPLEAINAISDSACAPSLSSDGRTLLFSSKHNGGHGNTDIWITRRLPKKKSSTVGSNP